MQFFICIHDFFIHYAIMIDLSSGTEFELLNVMNLKDLMNLAVELHVLNNALDYE